LATPAKQSLLPFKQGIATGIIQRDARQAMSAFGLGTAFTPAECPLPP
jgi:hypothetical protein